MNWLIWSLPVEIGLAVLFGYGMSSFLLVTLPFTQRYLDSLKYSKTPGARMPWPRPTEYQLKVQAWIVSSLFCMAVFLAADVIVAIEPYLVRTYLWSMRTIGLEATQLLLGGVVVALGRGAYVFKRDNQYLYGIVEVLFAFVAAVITARQMKAGGDWSPQVSALIGAVYIVSRGMGNIKEGQEGEQHTTVAEAKG